LKFSPCRSSVLVLSLLSGPLMYGQTPTFAGCNIFPANNVWNTPADKLPVDPNSAAYIASANATNNKLHPDFGHGTLLTGGMPYNIVPGNQPKFPVSFYYSGDAGPYPIPSNVNIELGSDHHAILIDNTNCVLYELFNLSGSGSPWRAGSGAIWSLNSDALRRDNQNSADAAGLPIFPGLVRYDEVASGAIHHALRVTIDHTRGAHIWPARSNASSLTGTQYPPMGQRFRLKASYDISGYPAPVQVVLQALKTYGMILADNGTSWHLSGIGDPRWNDDTMHALTEVTGDNFEAVDESSLMVDPNSGATTSTSSNATAVPTGWVNVVSKHSGKCLDMTGGPSATQQTDPAQQWSCLGIDQTNQQFQFTPVAGGYEIKARNSGLALQLTGGTSAQESAVLEDWPFESQSYQTWSVKATSDGYFTITANSSGACMDVRGDSKGNGAPIQQFSCTGQDNQKWSLVRAQ
jgi:Ricin-type beta-trefoil lectin domain